MKSDIIKVLRVIEYIGERSWVELTIAKSIHGTHVIENKGEIRAATIGAYPDNISDPDTKLRIGDIWSNPENGE